MADREMTYREAVREAMTLALRADPEVIVMGEDIGVYRGSFGVTGEMYREFGDRIVDTPISETAFVGCAIGAAMEGMRPIVEIMFSDFMAVCWDMIVNQAAKMHYMFGGHLAVPMVLRTASGSGTGAAAQHSQSLEAMLCHVPGLKVVAPSTPADAKGLLLAAIADDNPVIFLEQKKLYGVSGPVPEGMEPIPLGVADIKRPGRDCTVVTYGRMVPVCLEAAEKLAEQGVQAEVIDLRTLLPMDKDAVRKSVAKTHHLVIVHEAVKTGGLGGEISACVTESDVFYDLEAPILRLASEDVPVPFSPVLEQGVLPDPDKVAAGVLRTLAAPLRR